MPVPVEKCRVALPTYRVEPPDILSIDALKIVPKAPYRIGALDALQILATGTLVGQPISQIFPVDSSGMVDLGPAYGKVRLIGLSLDEAAEAIEVQLRRTLKQPQVAVSLAQSAGQQQVAGEHLVGSDGRIMLGTYGSVYVSGMTLAEVREAVQQHLSQFLDEPVVAVQVESFNSKVYYVIVQGAGFGDSITRFPITGNETVLDALANVNGLSRLSNQNKIWIARPSPAGVGCEQILRVNWQDITKRGETKTNFQILPGDRLFLAQDEFYAFDSFISKVTAPLETAFGVASLGVQSIFRLNHPNSVFNNGTGVP
jgi:polysaccharide export outer membrane protein